MPSGLDRYRYQPPRHEATTMTLRGRMRWQCVCGAQMKGWSRDPAEVMRSYAVHTGLVEKRK